MKNRSLETSWRRVFRFKRRLAPVCSLLAVGLGLLPTLPTKAASLQLVTDDWGASGVPTNVSLYVYVPDKVAANPPILVLLHYWGGGATGVFAEAQAGGIVSAADQYGFIMVVPQNPDCWDYSSAQSLTHDGGGQTQAITHMVNYTISKYHANANRVYVTGTSCGGMMTEALLAVYPEIFKAGAEFAGVPVGGAWTPVTQTAQQWGDLVRACYPGYAGPRPRVQLWHGTADTLVNYSNQLEAVVQWGNVLGLSANPAYSNSVTIGSITNQFSHQAWVDGCGNIALDAWSEIGGGHGTDANLNAQYVIPFLGLDKVGPVDPEDPEVYCNHGQRGRPHLNAARTTFVGDNGQRLRGPFTSTEWTPASTDVAMIKGMGFNALHLYAESFDPNYPANGSTTPGYAVANVDAIVAQARTNGLYLIMTIGNGAWNGNYNAAYITNFWKFYAQRYANETHVLFEIQNEPVAWGPPYSSPGATPPGALDMEVAAYRTIRSYAPETPVLLFSYAVLGDSGGASAALTDIRAFNTNVFGNASAVWTNEAVAFHGYAGATAMSNAVSQIIAAGYPCFMTEFGGGIWGTGVGGLDACAVADLEHLGVSWLTFQYLPPTGVSDDVTDPKRYEDIVNWSGLSWTPDFGNWPPVRAPYGNGGYPWTTPDYANNLLAGSLRIQAENFDAGGEGVAYHDLTATNLGGQYRTNEAVDIETTTDTGGGYDVTGTVAGEWLEYTIYVSEPGYYNLALRVAGTTAASAQVLAGGMNGTNLTGPWIVPATGGAQTWTTISNTVFLTPGQQVLHLDILSGGFNLNWLQLSPVTTGIIANGTYKVLNGASALAVTGVAGSNQVIAASYAGSSSQQWNLQHIGGGEYTITCAENGWSLASGGFYFWNNNHYLIQPAGNGYYRLVPTGNGYCFETVASNPSAIDEKVSNGSAYQRWAILAPSALQFPVGLNALATSGSQISLTWNAVGGATSYNVKRSTTSGGPYPTLASGVTATNFADTVSAGVNSYYVVSAVSSGVESLNSAEASVSLPYPWQSQDVGSVGLSGDANGSNGVFTVTGSGDDIWNAADAFRFVYTSVTGDCTIIARVVSVQAIDGWSKAGVMIRESTNANAVNAFVAVTPGNGVTWQYRSSPGGGSAYAATGGLGAPYWVKLMRSGNTFTGYRSADGTSWTQQGTATFPMASTADVGLAVTAHNNSSLCTAVFDNLSAPNWPPPTTPTGLSAVAPSWNQISLTWNGLAGATGYNVKRSTVSGGPYTIIATGLTGTNFTDFVASVRAGYFYVVSATVGGSETGNSPEATVCFPKLPGAIIGTAGSWNNSGNTIANVFDGNLNTFFDAPSGNGAWVGLDFGVGVSNIITQINYCPRAGFESRMVGGIFQGADQSSFSDAVMLLTVTNSPGSGLFTSGGITNLAGFRYVRYLSPNGGYGNVAELEFYGCRLTVTPPALMGMALTATNLTLSWPAECAGYALQSRTNLVLGNWANVTSPAPEIAGNQWRVVLPPPPAATMYYRLVK